MTWISIKERLPSPEECELNYGWFLVKHSYMDRACITRYDGHDRDHCYVHGWRGALDDVTHWMPLPRPPA